jgi:hypothetical protein
MDTTILPYQVLKNAFYDERVLLPEHALAKKEILQLEHNSARNKIDHPMTGSKDCSDAIAGVVYGLSTQRAIWARHKIPLYMVPRSLVAPTHKNSIGVQSDDRN